jgi:hypothetical protein
MELARGAKTLRDARVGHGLENSPPNLGMSVFQEDGK